MQVQASARTHFPNEHLIKSTHLTSATTAAAAADPLFTVPCPLEAWLPLEAQQSGLAPLRSSIRLADVAARASLQQSTEELRTSDGTGRGDGDQEHNGVEKEESCTEELHRLVAALLADAPSNLPSVGGLVATAADDGDSAVVSSSSTSPLAPPLAVEALLPLALPLLLPRVHTLLREVAARVRAASAAAPTMPHGDRTGSYILGAGNAAAHALACALAHAIDDTDSTTSSLAAVDSTIDSNAAQMAWERRALRAMSLLEALGAYLSLPILAVLVGVPHIDARSTHDLSGSSSSSSSRTPGGKAIDGSWLWPMPAEAVLGRRCHQWSSDLAAAVARLLAPEDAS